MVRYRVNFAKKQPSSFSEDGVGYLQKDVDRLDSQHVYENKGKQVGCAGSGAEIGTLWLFSHRNGSKPHLESSLFRYAVVGFALNEAMGLLSLMVAFTPLDHDSHLLSFDRLIIPIYHSID